MGNSDNENEANPSEVEIDIDTAINIRKGKRISATKMVDIINSNPNLSLAPLNYYIKKLDDLQNELSSYDTKIAQCMLKNSKWSADDYLKDENECDEYKNRIGIRNCY